MAGKATPLKCCSGTRSALHGEFPLALGCILKYILVATGLWGIAIYGEEIFDLLE